MLHNGAGAEPIVDNVGRLLGQSLRLVEVDDSDQGVAASAVNNGQVFRFLQKPCPIETLQSAIEAGLKQNQLVTVEKELFEETVPDSETSHGQSLAKMTANKSETLA